MEKQWYALYTRSRYEKRLHKLLQERQVEVYLPLVTAYRRWSDRMKRVEVPLFNSYIFVRTHPGDHNEYFSILQTPGAVRFIHFEGRLVPVPEEQIQMLRRLTAEGLEMESCEKPIEPGTPVEISYGPLKGIRGVVLLNGPRRQIIIQIDVLDKCIRVTLPETFVVKM